MDHPAPALERTATVERRVRVARTLRDVALVGAASLAFGGLTAPAQGWLPDPIRPLANSDSGWTLVTAVLVGALGRRARLSALLGAVGFVCLVLGYQVVSGLTGHPDSEQLFLVIAVVVGPVVGVAATWLRGRGARAALGCAVLAGIGIGDGTSGLLRVAATTGWTYWVLVAAAGVVLTVCVGVRLLRWRDRVLAAAGAIAVAALYVLILGVL